MFDPNISKNFSSKKDGLIFYGSSFIDHKYFIPNYKDLASVGLYFQNNKLTAKKRIMLEENLIKFLGRKNIYDVTDDYNLLPE